MSVLDKVRRWIDGESAETVLEQAARDAQVKPRSAAEEFIVKIAREIESVMQREMVPLPQGTTIIPSEYLIFLSEGDDKDWQGVKRRGLEQGLYHILAERAKEIAGKRKLETRSFVLELRVDGTLEKGELRVQHSWEDSSTGKTGVLARPKGARLPSDRLPSAAPRSDLRSTDPNIARQLPTDRTLPPQAAPAQPNFVQTHQYQAPPPTAASVPIRQAERLEGEEAEVMTNVRKRVTELYRLEIWFGGVRQNVVPIFNMETSVGRGSRSRPVDISLTGDPEISRRHASLITDGSGRFWILNEGRNPAMIAGHDLPSGQRIPVQPGTNIAVGSYILRIQPK
ncbi:MAG: FhaA domain-containing protein [Pyrinomonadaceae bacterium]